MTSEDRHNEFVQIRLWKDCINNCKFCYLKEHTDRTTTQAQKKTRLIRATKLVEEIDAKTIGLIGGEFFEGQLKGCEDEWFSFIEALKNSGSEIYITANLIHDQYLLLETVDALNKEVLICTSYDEVGRFHSEDARINWWKNVKFLHENDTRIFCNCIATQDFFEADVSFPNWLDYSLVDPHVSLEWIKIIDKNNYHDHLLKDCSLFNLPKRKTAISWFKKHPAIAKNYSSYVGNHSDLIYGFNKNDQVELEMSNRFTNDWFNNPKCSHPYISSCYADTDKCMMCDAKGIAQAQASDSDSKITEIVWEESMWENV